MIITAVSFIFMGVLLFLAGALVSEISGRLFGARLESFDSFIMAGIVLSTVYAEIFSLFSGVSACALAILAIVCLVTGLVLRKQIAGRIRAFAAGDGRYHFILLLILIAVVASIASLEPMDYDTYLYHGQAIKWIENYGSVKGLANLHPRFGYNSAYMCFQALFSFSFLGRSLHHSNGFIVLFMLFYALSDNFIIAKRKPDTTDLLKASMIFYVIYTLDSISSSGTDIFPMLALLYIFSKWIGVYKSGSEGKAAQYGLLCMLSVFCVTVKLSIAPVILLSVLPVVLLARKKELKKLWGFVITAVFIGLPYLIRNIILSGYLLYPMEKFDLLNVDWKVPAERAFTDRIEIEMYAKGLIGFELKSYPIRVWVQSWYRELLLVPRILLFVSGVLIVYFLIKLLSVLAVSFGKKNSGHSVSGNGELADERMFISGVALVSYIYWFLMAPNMRYGIVNLLLISSLVIGFYFNARSMRAFMVFLLVCDLMVFSEKADIVKTQTNLIYPEDYRRFECVETWYNTPKGNRVTVYVPAEGDQSGVDVFPEAPVADPEHEMLRGESQTDGFMPIPQ